MGNIFLNESHNEFSWNKLGDIAAGRGTLGDDMPVLVYRLLQYSINDVLFREYGKEKADELFRKAGYLAGKEFAENMLPLDLEFDMFVTELQKQLKDLRIGLLRIEEIDKDNAVVLTIAEDLDCSGLPVSDELICVYDEGFFAGIFEVYTGNTYEVRELDCWATGDRVCRYSCKVVSSNT